MEEWVKSLEMEKKGRRGWGVGGGSGGAKKSGGGGGGGGH